MATSVVIRKERIGEAPLTAEIARGTLVASRYEILGPLGKAVFKAHDRIRDATVALRILRWGLAGQEDRAREFRSQFERACSLRHENVCAFYEYGETKSYGATASTDVTLHYVTMEFVEGVTLPQLLRAPKALSLNEAFELSVALALAVQAAHDAGSRSLDLQPHNIMRDARGSVRLMGVARDLLRDAELVGYTGEQRPLANPAYLSPERIRGETIDQRSDVWSLACLVFEIFTGRPAFRGETRAALAIQIARASEPAYMALNGADLPPAVIALLAVTLLQDPRRRFATARDFAAGLRTAQRLSAPKSVVAPPEHRTVSWKKLTLGLGGRQMLLEGVTKPTGSADEVRARIGSFLAARGYTAAKASAGPLTFRRGSWIGTLTGFSPKKWQARVTVQEIDRERLRAVFDMNTTLQTVYQMEVDFWVEEINGLLAVIEGREPPSMLAADRRIETFGSRALKDQLTDQLIGAVGLAIVGFLLIYFLDRLKRWFGWLFD